MTREQPDRDAPFVEFAPGEVIIDATAPARAVYVIQSGRVQVRRGAVPLAGLESGDVFGEAALLAPQQVDHGMEVVALTAVRALRIEPPALLAVMRESPEVAMALLRQLAARLHTAPGAAVPAGARQGDAPAFNAVPAFTAPARAAALAAAAPQPPAASANPSAEPTAAPAPPAPSRPPVPAAPAAGRPSLGTAQSAAAPVAARDPAAAGPPPPTSPAATAPAVPPAASATPRPQQAQAPTQVPYCIRHANGVIALGERSEWLVGRPDPATGQVPEIDLGPLDVARSLSRRHARLRRDGAQLMLSEEPGVANGTWVNGQRVMTGTSVRLEAGDKLRFGAVEVQLTGP